MAEPVESETNLSWMSLLAATSQLIHETYQCELTSKECIEHSLEKTLPTSESKIESKIMEVKSELTHNTVKHKSSKSLRYIRGIPTVRYVPSIRYLRLCSFIITY
jgi:uncharacterized radical SAM superfamily protein